MKPLPYILLILSLLLSTSYCKSNESSYAAAIFAAVPYSEYDFSYLNDDIPSFGDLPYSQCLANNVDSVLNNHHIKSQLFLKDEATKSNFMNLNDTVQIIIISCHGEKEVLYLADEHQGSVILTQNDIISKKFFNLQIVIITACNSATGENSIAQSFLKAGAKFVLASGDETNDYISSVFVPFFLDLILSGFSPSESLSKTKHYIKTLDYGFWDGPEYWDTFNILESL